MLLVLGKRRSRLRNLYQSGQLPPSPAQELAPIRFARSVLEALVETNTRRNGVSVDHSVAGSAFDCGDIVLVRAVIAERLDIPGLLLESEGKVPEIARVDPEEVVRLEQAREGVVHVRVRCAWRELRATTQRESIAGIQVVRHFRRVEVLCAGKRL